ncbi:hypothetical protein AMTR_s00131p00079710 [Amborella trichopoda]|uniref:Uncharacterized protein n=1 Tax=Amborella trichopoda TaxID=13333 RepID=W1NR54_AMBTC|nr:hypothetical protein AMTR_s00131p00079710 [Amborella trichopoda]
MAAHDPNSATNFIGAFYRRLGQSSHMSANSTMSLQTSDRVAPIVTTGVDSSIGSNTSRVTMFIAYEHISGNPSNTGIVLYKLGIVSIPLQVTTWLVL